MELYYGCVIGGKEKNLAKYEKMCATLGVNMVVLDGYWEESTKDATRSIRAKTSLATANIMEDAQGLSDRSAFFGNYQNKSRFVEKFGQKLMKYNIHIIQASSDADMTIVKTAINHELLKPSAQRVVVMADDTDILCLLIHHWTSTRIEYSLCWTLLQIPTKSSLKT